jgi:hypothetical protein
MRRPGVPERRNQIPREPGPADGDTWQDISDEGLRSEKIMSLKISDHTKVYAGTQSGKVFVSAFAR